MSSSVCRSRPNDVFPWCCVDGGRGALLQLEPYPSAILNGQIGVLPMGATGGTPVTLALSGDLDGDSPVVTSTRRSFVVRGQSFASIRWLPVSLSVSLIWLYSLGSVWMRM